MTITVIIDEKGVNGRYEQYFFITEGKNLKELLENGRVETADSDRLGSRSDVAGKIDKLMALQIFQLYTKRASENGQHTPEGEQMMGPFPKADEARKQVEEKRKAHAYNSFGYFRSSLEGAVRRAVANCAVSARVEIPQSLDETTLYSIKKSFEGLGYKVKVDQEEGTLATNLVRLPRKFFTLHW